MIIEGLFALIKGIINLIPFSLPSLPDKFDIYFQMLKDGILDSLGLLNLFIDLRFWLSCMAVMLIIYNIKKVWNGIIFCLNLIPSVNISYWE